MLCLMSLLYQPLVSFFFSSCHQSGYPCNLKHVSIVCLTSPQCVQPLPSTCCFVFVGLDNSWSDACYGLCLPPESMTPLGVEPSFVNITTCLKSSLRTYSYVCSTVGKGWIWSMTPLTLSSRSSSPFRKVYTLSSCKIEL